MFKYAVVGLVVLLIGLQLIFIASPLGVSSLPATCLCIVGVLIILAAFWKSMKNAQEESRKDK
ncbi:uncharacterized membrane protein YidH (DUF202 family) [Enterococcus sp. PF1-24]|uniref:hypothetical protein n=1 Tax=unclassified Enterococcus TaxID=2608891 RepID=UPI0024767669|nr:MULTISPECIES: hypothetical protein [unclassified Enterococcus]MDH6363573.1 uncharacterized membrane protein YidH (DUF202 family) [Enterococcus sp. PFB1-1]MDH6400808.1 uncharacterized membrane protein YidH (DUF202 family) [Enterococcus sp. PF1-24]